jgi:hypothetical protein
VARFFAERAMLSPLLNASAKGDAAAIKKTTQKMIWTALPWYIPGRIGWFFGKVLSRVKRIASGTGSASR